MIIRSQNKDCLFFTENIKEIGINNNYEALDIFDKKHCSTDILIDNQFVGRYSTEEKALRVLDLIQQHCYHFINSQNIHSTMVAYPTFQMPQDDEV